MSITEKTKQNVIAMLKLGDTPESIAEQVDLPAPLIREWMNAMDTDTLAKIEATTIAVERITNDPDVVSVNKEMLVTKLHNAADSLVAEMAITARHGDLAKAKAISLLAEACKNLYFTLVQPNKNPDGGSAPTVINLLNDLRRD